MLTFPRWRNGKIAFSFTITKIFLLFSFSFLLRNLFYSLVNVSLVRPPWPTSSAIYIPENFLQIQNPRFGSLQRRNFFFFFFENHYFPWRLRSSVSVVKLSVVRIELNQLSNRQWLQKLKTRKHMPLSLSLLPPPLTPPPKKKEKREIGTMKILRAQI